MRRTERGPGSIEWNVAPRWRATRKGAIALGPGKADLLEAIAASGSISAAARALGMSYRRAWVLVATMNACFVRPLVTTTSRRSAGAALTPDGRAALALYRRIEARSLSAARRDIGALLRLLRRPRLTLRARSPTIPAR
ncbi:MAG TPA: LysR family transcriptional regulator [Candidatus Polarisedimenticolia bacterium]|nr:LysR family transcriptional regulator [Candidatus Polarisedimenticolia bacterium]